MRLDVVTIFPEYLEPLRHALLGKAIEQGRLTVGVHDLRDWAPGVHQSVDSPPFGGGPGMVMKPQVWGPALDDVARGRVGHALTSSEPHRDAARHDDLLAGRAAATADTVENVDPGNADIGEGRSSEGRSGEGGTDTADTGGGGTDNAGPGAGGTGGAATGRAEADAASAIENAKPLLIVPTPAGTPFTQADARRWSHEKHIVFACGRYEGIDQRVIDDAANRYRVREVSIGDYVLIGGEVAVLVIAEAVVRLVPGVLGNRRSHEEDSFSDGLLEGPCYTKPRSWRGLEVPEVLTSGDHAKVDRFHREQALRRTLARRPELLHAVELDHADRAFLAGLGAATSQGTDATRPTGGDAGPAGGKD